MRDVTIGKVMSDCPFVIGAEAPLDYARSIMYREKIRHLPVVVEGRLAGILTDRDVNLAAYLADDLLDGPWLTVGDACTQEPFTAEVDEPLVNVLNAMAKRRIGSALVVDNDRLIGIFTMHDACLQLARFLEPDATVGEVAGELAASCA